MKDLFQLIFGEESMKILLQKAFEDDSPDSRKTQSSVDQRIQVFRLEESVELSIGSVETLHRLANLDEGVLSDGQSFHQFRPRQERVLDEMEKFPHRIPDAGVRMDGCKLTGLRGRGK